MGRRALKNVTTRRYGADEYDALASRMKTYVSHLFGTRVHVVQAYRQKETHGDMDILLYNDNSFGNVKDMINEYFKPGEIHCNGGTYSFDYEELQIDIILVVPDHWDTSVVFFDYDPSGNLMGKIAHKFGLKYGFQGLVYPYRTTYGTEFGNITVSTDNRKIFEFLGFDYDVFLAGFDTKQEIFDYVANNKYFDPQNFLIENLNSIDRKRNKKRATYQEFLAYINAQVEAGRKWNQTFDENKEKYLPYINEAFPEAGIYDEINKYKGSEARRIAAYQKFNGDIINVRYGIGGIELGKFITGFKSFVVQSQRALGKTGLDKTVFDNYLHVTHVDDINATMDIYFKEHFKK